MDYYNSSANKNIIILSCRGLVSFDIELDSIDIDECDAPNKTAQPQKDRVLLRFYGAHACRDTTEVGWLHNNVFFFNCRKNAGNVMTFSKKCSSQ